MALTAHLSYSGECREAFIFYAELFGGELMLLAYGDTPMAMEVPPDWSDKNRARDPLLDGCELAGSDVQSVYYQRPQGFSVLVDIEGVEKARRLFSALAEGGSVEVPMQETFWSPSFGVLTDRFSIPWEINGKSSDQRLFKT
jgi:PhnB protein